MAVGDVVSAVSAVGVNLTFQPAAGVECMITSYFESSGTLNNFRITNGIVQCGNSPAANVAPNPTNMKMFINNTNYLFIIVTAGNAAAYTGVQIK